MVLDNLPRKIIMARYTTFSFTVDDLFNGLNNSDNFTSVQVRTRDYSDGYNRIMAAAKAQFAEGTTLRYDVTEGCVDDSRSVMDGSRYTVVQSKDFFKRPLPATLEEYRNADKDE